MDPVSPKNAREILTEHGLRINKKLGQNFLIDENVIKRIVAAGDLKETDTVVEIGPGLGALTRYLALQAGRVICIELDRGLVAVLAETLACFGNVSIVQGDALKINLDALAGKLGTVPYKVVANLPYYITTPLIMHFLTNQFRIKKMVLMVQKEVARRMVAQPGTAEYGSLTVAVRYFCRCGIKFIVPPTVFLPKPEVESAVVELEPLDTPAVLVKDRDFFFQVVRAAFNKRRKTLPNALANSPLALDKRHIQAVLAELGMDPKVRGEKLSIDQFARLANSLGK